ncbi:MAG: NAD(P)-binding domain-containing protein, partial [Candidatus Rokuibacteriota bacterium]
MLMTRRSPRGVRPRVRISASSTWASNSGRKASMDAWCREGFVGGKSPGRRGGARLDGPRPGCSSPATRRPARAGVAGDGHAHAEPGRTSEMKVGFIGTGSMGRPMLRNLVTKGFPVVAYDVQPAALEAAAGLGATPAGSAAAAA